jgi:hypothetical protein
MDLVVISSNRFDLLKRTLESFIEFNTYPIKRIILSDDSHKGIPGWFFKLPFSDIQCMYCNERDQVKNIDNAYSKIESEYFFHLEDDWEFYKPGFIEASLSILKKERNCINVWLRERNDTNTHPIENDRLIFDYEGWHGFTWNPTVKRLRDYNHVKPFTRLTQAKSLDAERKIGEVYKRLGYYAKITPEGYVRHIGQGRHVWG